MATEIEEYVLETSGVASGDDTAVEFWAEVQFQDFRVAASGKVTVSISTGDVTIGDSGMEQWLQTHPNTRTELMEVAEELRTDELPTHHLFQ